MLRSDNFFAPPPQPATEQLENGVKVKFLKTGRQAFMDLKMGQFNFTEGEEKSGIPEADALRMKAAGTCQILGDDTVEAASEKVSDNDGNGHSDGAVIKKGNMPWNKNK